MIDWPDDYLRLRSDSILGRLVDPIDPLFVWDVRFLAIDIADADDQPLEDQIFKIAPFATTSSGDYWAYQLDALPSSDVLLCYHDADDAEWVAPNMASLLFRQTASVAGYVELGDPGDAWDIAYVRSHIREVSAALKEFLTPDMLAALDQLCAVDTPFVQGECTTLVSPEHCDAITANCLNYRKLGDSTMWREC